ADAVFLQRLHEGRFRIAGWWLREVLLRLELPQVKGVPGSKIWQRDCLQIPRIIIPRFFIELAITREAKGAGVSPEQIIYIACLWLSLDVDSDGVQDSIRHLAGD